MRFVAFNITVQYDYIIKKHTRNHEDQHVRLPIVALVQTLAIINNLKNI